MIYSIIMKEEKTKQIKKRIKEEIQNTISSIKEYKSLTKPITPENAIGRVSRMDAINNKSVIEAGKPKDLTDETISLIEKTFGSCDAMKEQFSKAAMTRFGSGWAWLCVKNGELSICSTPNQDNPIMDSGCGGTPILGLDVWEHAYYLNYQNRRADYINAFWNLVNWSVVDARLKACL